MDVPNLDTLEQEWKAFLSAPYIITPLIVVAGVIGWWLRGIKSGRKIDGLEADSKLADKRAAWAIELKDEAIKAIEAERQFKDSRADIIASSGNDSLAERLVKVEAAVEKLSVANNAARSAIGIAVGTLAATEIGDSFSNTPLASSDAQANVHKWWG